MVSLRLWQCWKLSVTGVGRYESIEKVVIQAAPVRSHQSMGSSERSIQTIRHQMWTLMLSVMAQARRRICFQTEFFRVVLPHKYTHTPHHTTTC